MNWLKNCIKTDDQRHINPKRFFLIYSIIVVIVFFSTTIFQFWKQTNIRQAEIITEAESTFNTSKQMYNNVLKKTFTELHKTKNYDEYHIQKTIAKYYPVLQELKYRQDGEALFWISKNNTPVIIDYNSIVNYSLYQEKFIKKQNIVDQSYQTNYIEPGYYVFCKQVLDDKKQLGHLCVLQDIKWMIVGLSKLNPANYDVQINDTGTGIAFLAPLKNPIASYAEFMLSQSAFLFLWLLMSFWLYSFLTKHSNNEFSKLKRHGNILSKRLQFLRALEAENQERSGCLVPKAARSKFADISNQDIDVMLNYFYQQIVEQKLSAGYVISDEIKEIQCDILLIHRLLMSLITESVYSISQKAIVNIKLEVITKEKEKHIKIIYSDNSYAMYSKEINEKLKEHMFYIDKKTFHDSVYLAGGTINETYMEYKEKGMELILPCTDYKIRGNVVVINADKNTNESD